MECYMEKIMFIEWKSIALIISIIFVMLLIIKFIDKKIKLNGEIKRKLFHTSMGLTMLLLPYLFTSTISVLMLGIIALFIMYFLKNVLFLPLYVLALQY